MSNDLKTFEYPFKGLGVIPNQQNVLTKDVWVVDTNGNPLSGAHFYINGAAQSPISDAEGKRRVAVASPNDVITITYVGKKPISVKFQDLGSMQTMQDDLAQLPGSDLGMVSDSKVNWLKWGSLAVVAVILITMIQAQSPKKVTV